MITPRLSAAALAALATIILLSGCVPAPPSPTATPSTSSTASTSPTPSATAIDPNVLFTISATVTSQSGQPGHIVQTVYKPVATLADLAAVQAQLDTECDGWQTEFPTAEYLVSTIIATTADGSAWPDHVVASFNGWPVFTGDYDTFQAYCASVQIRFPGTVRGVTPVPAGGSADAPGGWATLFTGFGIPTGPDHPDTPQPGDTTLTDCVVTLGPDAASLSAIAPTWPGGPQVYPGLTCDVNRN